MPCIYLIIQLFFINALCILYNKNIWFIHINMMCSLSFMLFLLPNAFHFNKKWNNALFSYIFHLFLAKNTFFFAFDQLKFILKAYCCVYKIPWPLKHIIRHQKQSSRSISSFFIIFCIFLRRKWRPSWICQSCELKGGLQPIFLLIFLKDT